jgi:hypothetical protein
MLPPDIVHKIISAEYMPIRQAPLEGKLSVKTICSFDINGGKKYFDKKYLTYFDGKLLYYADYNDKGGVIKAVNPDGSLAGYVLGMNITNDALIEDQKPSKLKSFSKKVLSLIDAQETGAENTDTQTRNDARTQLSEAGITVDENSDVRFSVRWTPGENGVPNVENIAKLVAETTGRSYEESLRWVEAEYSIANIILGKPEFLDFDPDNRYDFIKNNTDYPQGTVDPNNLCRKREEFTVMFDMLQRMYPNKTFTALDVADMRHMLDEEGITVACGACFVEDRRQLLGEIADTFIGMWKEAAETGKPLQKTNAAGVKKTMTITAKLAKAYGLTKGATIYAEDKYIPNQYDLTTYEGFKKLEREHPMTAYSFIAYNNSRGQQAARLIEGRAEYSRQILGWSDKKVQKVNNLGGLRIFSFSDFQAVSMLDIIQVIIDCSARGVKIQGYTKVPEFAKLIRNTGIKINRSLMPKGETGLKTVNGKKVLDYDTKEGIDVNDEDFLDEADNPNVGNILVGINAEQIGIAFLDDFVDYIIPFHTNKSKEVCKALGLATWQNYKESQHEKDIASGKASKHNVNIYTQVISKYGPTNKVEFVDSFLKECRRQKKIPRYAEFLNKEYKADGAYTDEGGSFDYTYREGYHKLLVDFKMFDKQGNILLQGNVTPDMDSSFMETILAREVEKKEGYKFPQKVFDGIQEKYGEQADRDLEAAIRGIETDVQTDDVNEIAEQVTDVMNTTRFSERDYSDRDETYSGIGKEHLAYEEGNAAPDLTLVETFNDRTGKTETTVKHYGQKPKDYVPKKIAYCYKLFEQHPDGSLHALFAGAKAATPIGEWQYAQGFPYTDAGVKGMNLRERYGWHLSAGLPSAPHLMSSKDFARGYPSKNAYGHPKGSKRVWVRMAYDASTDFNAVADSTREGDIFGLIPFGGYYAFKENNQSEWVISSAVKIDKILKEEERQQILKEAGYDEYEAWRKKHRATEAEKAESKRRSAENKKAKDKAKKEGINYLSESAKEMREAIKSRIIDNPELQTVRYSERDYAPTFYSHMGKVIDGIKAEKVSANGVIPYLKGKGVKNEEIKWSGIEAFLEGKKSLTKQELQEFVAGSMLQIEEVTLDNKEIPFSEYTQSRISAYERERDGIVDELKAEWKRVFGNDIPIQHFGAGLESAVVSKILEAEREVKNSQEVGKKMAAARES